MQDLNYTIVSLAGVLCLGTVAKAQPEKMGPNIVMVTCHDLGQHLCYYGVPSVNSPNIDRLASKGVMFSNFYSTSAVSSPGRASLATGRYPQSNGMMGLTHAPWWWELNEGERHIAELLSHEGYRTTLIGFQHIGQSEKLGFKEHLSQKNNALETVKAATGFFNKKEIGNQPFYLEIGFTEVHDPYKHGIDSTKGIFIPGYLEATEEIRLQLAKFQGDIRFLDDCVGQIVSAIEKSPVSGNTLIIFTSDHGIGFPGAKWSARKAGISVPLIIYMPGSIFSGGKVFNETISNIDVLPTLLEYVHLDGPENIEGISFVKFISGKEKTAPRKFAFAQYTHDMKRDNQSRTVISGKYQMIWYFDAGRTVKFPTDASPSRFSAHVEREKTVATRPFYELFDLEQDPWELNDLGGKGEYRETVEELSEELVKWMQSVDDPLLSGPLATPYYTRSLKDLMEKARPSELLYPAETGQAIQPIK